MQRVPDAFGGGDDDDAEEREFLHGFDRIEQRITLRNEAERRVKYAKVAAVALAVLIGVGLIVGLSVGAKKVSAAPYECRTPAGAAYDATFFVIGDWGRRGNGGQRAAARMMADVARCMAPDFILSTGDNFYDHGLKAADDPLFKESFTDVYSAPSLAAVPWYAVLGNHDYNDGVDPRSNGDCAATALEACPRGCCYSPVWQFTSAARNDARWHLSNGSWAVPGLPPALLAVVMLDTNPFITRYMTKGWAANAAGLRAQNATAVREQLEARLAAAAPAAWRFVVGHHPVASFGEHCAYSMAGDCAAMAWLQPLLARAGVAAYFSGHDHDMQLVVQTKSGGAAEADGGAGGDALWPLYVVSGGGSDVRSGEQAYYKPRQGYALPLFMDDQGFVAVRVNRTHAVIDVYTSNRLLPAATRTLAAPSAAAARGSGGGGGDADEPAAAADGSGDSGAAGSNGSAAAVVDPALVGRGEIPGLPGTHVGRGRLLRAQQQQRRQQARRRRRQRRRQRRLREAPSASPAAAAA